MPIGVERAGERAGKRHKVKNLSEKRQVREIKLRDIRSKLCSIREWQVTFSISLYVYMYLRYLGTIIRCLKALVAAMNQKIITI